MTEHLQTRTEHSRSIEDAKRYRALDDLKEVGLLTSVSSLETFHGRVATPDEAKWAVDPSFANGGNDSGNNNVNNMPTLYTADKKTAQDFADTRAGFSRAYHLYLSDKVKEYTPEENISRLERQNAFMQRLWEEDVANGHEDAATSKPTVWTMEKLLQSNSQVEAQHLREALGQKAYDDFKRRYIDERRSDVHEIVTRDIDATVLNLKFDETKLDAEAMSKYRSALAALRIPMTEGSPVTFDNRHTIEPFVATMQKHRKNLVPSNEINGIAHQAGIDKEVALQLAGAYNAGQLMGVAPVFLVKQLLSHSENIPNISLNVGGEQQEMPINLEYIQRFLREAHIVGVKQDVNSATLGRSVSSVSFFDLIKVATTEQRDTERNQAWRVMGHLATGLESLHLNASPFMKVLEDVHAKPYAIVDAARDVEGFASIFDMNAGNWEDFTLAEHTETVLRNFDENYADDIPVEMLAPMRLAIVAHDIGKPIAAQDGELRNQYVYNTKYADVFYDRIGIDKKTKNLLLAVIGKGAQLMFALDVKKQGLSVEQQMNDFAKEVMGDFYGTTEATDEQVRGFIEMCRMLQVCDGGAYTTMAITRKRGGTGRYRNSPSFQGSFEEPVGFGKRDLKLK